MSSVNINVPSTTRLFKPLKVGHWELKHRVVLLPLTRFRNDDNHVPVPAMEQYYADRACAPGTLIISEATGISPAEEGQRNNPGFSSDEQVRAWKSIIDKVHAQGSIYFQQIWAMGRASHPDYLAERGFDYRSCSDVPLPKSDVKPRAMTEDEILQTIQDFADTARRVVAAGGDGIEIHSAHGYLLDQFLSESANQRTDKWGGSIENRARLTLEVVRACVAAIGAERVAIRLSPFAGFQGSEKKDINGLYAYLIAELRNMNAKFAYLSLVEAAGDPAPAIFEGEWINQGRTLDFILEAWNNQSPVLVGGAYRPDTAGWAVEEHYKKWDVLIGFGRHFLANPDLVYRIQKGIPLNKYVRATFYTNKSALGYNDYPFSEDFLTESGNGAVPSAVGQQLDSAKIGLAVAT